VTVSPAIVKAVMLASAALFLLAWWQRDALPSPERLAAPTFDEPLQLPTDRAPFQTTVGGIEYTVRPLYTYDLSGLVVSKHNADTWWDWIHAATNDKLNVTDLCVVWGANAHRGIYRELDFSSGEFTCYVESHSLEAWAAFDMTALSNNHLLTDDPRLAKVLRNVRVGDQIHFRGYLAEYSHHHGFAYHRGTSITRTDTGNGACETVFATDVEILRHGNRGWRIAFWASACLLFASVAAWFTLPFADYA
jgi:hypothetical protein